MSMVVTTLDQVITDVQDELTQLFAPGTPSRGSLNTSYAYLGASPYYWGNLCDTIGRAMGWGVPYPSAPASVYGWVESQTTATADMASTIQTTVANLAQGLTAARTYADQVGLFYGTLAGQASAGSGAQAIAVAETLFNKAEADIGTVYAASVAGLERLNAASVRARLDLYNLAVARTDTRYYQAENDINTEAARRAQGDAAVAAAATARADIRYYQAENDLNTAVKSLTADMAAQRNQLEMEIGLGVSTAEGYATAVAARAEDNAVARAVAQTAPALSAIGTELDTCLAPLCDEVTPNAKQLGRLGRILKGFEGAGFAALLAGLVAEAVHDPQTAARGILDVTGWIPDLADRAYREVAG